MIPGLTRSIKHKADQQSAPFHMLLLYILRHQLRFSWLSVFSSFSPDDFGRRCGYLNFVREGVPIDCIPLIKSSH